MKISRAKNRSPGGAKPGSGKDKGGKKGKGKPGAGRSGKRSSANTAAFHYFAKPNVGKSCEDDKKRIRKNCDDTEKNNAQSKESLDKARIDGANRPSGVLAKLQKTAKTALTTIDGAGKARSGYQLNDKNKWMENHCSGLWNKPGGQNGEGVSNTQDFKNQIEKSVNEVKNNAEKVATEAMDKLRNFAGDYMKGHLSDTMGAAAKKAAERAALSRFPALMSLVGRFSFWEGTGKLLGNVAGAVVTGDMEKQFDVLEKAVTVAKDQVQQAASLLKPGGLEDAMASTMAGIAIANPCIKARKCLLVPYKDSGKTDGSGCCPGQTGHHVLPDSMFQKYEAKADEAGKTSMKQTGKKRDCWDKYSKGGAPTMCLEGTTNRVTNGSHGLAHQGTAAVLDRDVGKHDMSYEDAATRISKMLAKPFGCDPNCIKAQLDDYYKKAHTCGALSGAQVTPHSGESGGGPKPETSDNF